MTMTKKYIEMDKKEIAEICKRGGDDKNKLNQMVSDHLDNLTLSDRAKDIIAGTEFPIMADTFGGLFTVEEVENFIAENYASAEAEELAGKIRKNPEWNLDDCRELCDMAGIIEEWEQADGAAFEQVVEKAAEILKVDIY